jgi:hypothetical protein
MALVIPAGYLTAPDAIERLGRSIVDGWDGTERVALPHLRLLATDTEAAFYEFPNAARTALNNIKMLSSRDNNPSPSMVAVLLQEFSAEKLRLRRRDAQKPKRRPTISSRQNISRPPAEDASPLSDEEMAQLAVLVVSANGVLPNLIQARERWAQAESILQGHLASGGIQAVELCHGDGAMNPIPNNDWLAERAARRFGRKEDGLVGETHLGFFTPLSPKRRTVVSENELNHVVNEITTDVTANVVPEDCGGRSQRSGRPPEKRDRIEKWIRDKYPNGKAEEAVRSDLISEINADLGRDFAKPDTVVRVLARITKNPTM